MHHYRAQALQSLKRFDDALSEYSYVLKQAPKFGAAHLGRFIIFCELRRYNEAMSDAKALTALGVTEPEESLKILLGAK